jgi:Ferritin-like domain
VEALLTRSHLLRGAAVAIAGGVFVSSADAAPPAGSTVALVGGDLAYVRLLVGIELLLVDFHANAVSSGHLEPAVRFAADRALVNEDEHYAYLAGVLTDAAATVLTSADVTFSYPAGAFYSASSVTALAVTLERLALGAYLGAAGNIANSTVAQAIAQITACEAQHLAAFSLAQRTGAFHDAFPQSLTIAQASDALDGYAS